MQVRRASLSAVAVLAFVFLLSGIASSEIRFGTLPQLSTAELQEMYNPIVEYLAAETGERVTLVIPKDFKAFSDAVRAGHIDVALANPLVYVQLKKNIDLDPLALASEAQSGTRLRGIIIARKDSGITKPQDLKNKKVIFVEKDSAAGYVFQMLLLSRAGLDVNKDITMLPFAKNQENVVMAVFNKSADAGGIRESVFEKNKRQGGPLPAPDRGLHRLLPELAYIRDPKTEQGKVLKDPDCVAQTQAERPAE